MKLKELFLTAVCLTVFAGPVTSLYALNLDLTPAETQWLAEHPVIRAGVGTSFPPIQYVTQDHGEYSFNGIASDYLERLSEMLGVEFLISYGITFAEALEMGKNREIDIFPCLAYNSERDENLEFTDGYLENPIVIFSNQNAPFISSLQDLSGLRVSDVEALYINQSLKQDVPGIEFVYTDNPEACLEAVAFGRADANVAGLISGSYIIRKNNWTNIKVAAPSPYPNTVFRMAVREDWSEFRTILDKALDAIDQQERNEINQKWIAVRYEYGLNRGDLFRLAGRIIGAAAIIIGLILAWGFNLRAEIRIRKKVEASLSESEARLKVALKEKEILMRESEHRIKNNLNLVSSLIQMQAAEFKDKIDAEKMEMLIKRIRSIILLHNKLSLSENMESINAEEYIRELIAGLRDTVIGYTGNIAIDCSIVKSFFGAEIIIPLGLIITELVTNAAKYGFGESESGSIGVLLERTSDTDYRMIVKNNGAPIPDDVDPEHSATLGLQLVHSLVSQLNGRLEITKSPTPLFLIEFGV